MNPTTNTKITPEQHAAAMAIGIVDYIHPNLQKPHLPRAAVVLGCTPQDSSRIYITAFAHPEYDQRDGGTGVMFNPKTPIRLFDTMPSPRPAEPFCVRRSAARHVPASGPQEPPKAVPLSTDPDTIPQNGSDPKPAPEPVKDQGAIARLMQFDRLRSEIQQIRAVKGKVDQTADEIRFCTASGQPAAIIDYTIGDAKGGVEGYRLRGYSKSGNLTVLTQGARSEAQIRRMAATAGEIARECVHAKKSKAVGALTQAYLDRVKGPPPEGTFDESGPVAVDDE